MKQYQIPTFLFSIILYYQSSCTPMHVIPTKLSVKIYSALTTCTKVLLEEFIPQYLEHATPWLHASHASIGFYTVFKQKYKYNSRCRAGSHLVMRLGALHRLRVKKILLMKLC